MLPLPISFMLMTQMLLVFLSPKKIISTTFPSWITMLLHFYPSPVLCLQTMLNTSIFIIDSIILAVARCFSWLTLASYQRSSPSIVTPRLSARPAHLASRIAVNGVFGVQNTDLFVLLRMMHQGIQSLLISLSQPSQVLCPNSVDI